MSHDLLFHGELDPAMAAANLAKNSKATQFSFSRISDFGNCPYQFFAKYLRTPKIPFVETNSTKRGSTVHKMMELRLRAGPGEWDEGDLCTKAAMAIAKDKKISSKEAMDYVMAEMAQWGAKYERWAQLVFSLGGKRYVEMQNAVAKDVMADDNGKQFFRSTTWFGKDVFFRAAADCFVKRDPDEQGITRGVMIDWKTGTALNKRGEEKYNPSQAAVTAMVCFSSWPAVQVIDTLFVWVDEETPFSRRERFHRGDLAQMIGPVKDRMSGIIECAKRDEWPMKTSGLCRGWCPVKDCPNWEDAR